MGHHRVSIYQSAAQQRLNYFRFQHIVMIDAGTQSFPSLHKLRLRVERFLTEERHLTMDLTSPSDLAFGSTLLVEFGFVCVGFRNQKEAAICKLMFGGEAVPGE